MIQLTQVQSAFELNEFIDLPFQIYQKTLKDPYWVPPLRIAVRDLLDVTKNPFFKHAERVLFLAHRTDSKTGKVHCVGRIAAIIDQNHNETHQEKCGFFGFFESIHDQEVANLLLDKALSWLKSKGMSLMRGPMNPSTNHECGLLIEGFDDPPQVMMTYNPPYYLDLLQNAGLVKAKDLFAYTVDGRKSKFSERLFAHAERIKKRGHIHLRRAKISDFDQEIDRILEVYNDAWESNWGFVPLSAEEFRHAAKDMKLIMDPRLLLIAEVRGQVAGFGLALPDVNQVLKKNPSGRLLPFGIFKLLWGLKGPFRHKTINRCRILTLGIKKEFRELGLGAVMYVEYFKESPTYGYPIGEASWILEDNKSMTSALKLMGAERYKTYRILERSI